MFSVILRDFPNLTFFISQEEYQRLVSRLNEWQESISSERPDHGLFTGEETIFPLASLAIVYRNSDQRAPASPYFSSMGVSMRRDSYTGYNPLFNS